MGKESKSFFDDIDLSVTSQDDGNLLDDKSITKLYGLNEFKESIAGKVYHQRGFIKDGELVVSPEDIIMLQGKIEQREEDGIIFNQYGENIFLVTTDNDNLTVNDIENHLLDFVADKLTSNQTKATFYVFNHFREENVDTPIHNNELYEFKGEFVIAKAVRGWVLLSYEKVIHFPHTAIYK